MIPRLGEHPGDPFPPAEEAMEHPDGLLAWGGDLQPWRLEAAYKAGIFPWFSDEEPPLWWNPSERCVLYPQHVHVSRRLARTLRQGRFKFTMDQAFEAVVDACAESRGSTWITPEMKKAYLRMHELGHGHSMEAWLDDTLVGGLYGLSWGGVFFGESMFSAERDASKMILVELCAFLDANGIGLFDCQVHNPHLESMGAVMIPRQEFLDEVALQLQKPALEGDWSRAYEHWRVT